MTRTPLAAVPYATLEENIFRLRKAGKKNHDIACLVGLSYGKVCTITAQLVRKGRLPDGRGRFTDVEVRSKRRSVILRMRRAGATLAEIGRKLGVTRERARQLHDALEADRGPVPCEWLTIPRAAALLGASKSTLNQLRLQGALPVKRGAQGFLLSQRDLKKVRHLLKKRRSRKCVNCGRKFESDIIHKLLCSLACRRQWSWRLQKKRLRTPASKGVVRGWPRRLWELLRDRPLPANEEWLSRREAARRSGLNISQLFWLRRRGIMRSRRLQGASRQHLLAASEVELARKIWREERARRAAP